MLQEPNAKESDEAILHSGSNLRLVAIYTYTHYTLAGGYIVEVAFCGILWQQ